MKRIVNLCMILAVSSLMMTSCNCYKKMAKKVNDVTVTCNPQMLTLKGQNIVTDVTVQFPAKYYNKKAVAKITPVLEFQGGKIEGAPQYFQGSKVKDNYTVIDSKTGGKYTMHVSIPYDSRAKVSTLVLVVEARCEGKGDKLTEIARIPVAEGVNTLQQDVNYTSALEPMTDKYEKTSTINQKAEILYVINKSDVRKDQLSNDQLKAFENFVKENSSKDRVKMGSIYANGYASPDGPEKFNDNLSKARSESGKKAINEQLSKVSGVSYDAASYGEDWEGFKELVENSNIEDKDLILQVLKNYSNPAERDEQIKNMSAVFQKLATDVLPKLRRTQFVASAEVQNLTDAELQEAVKNGKTKDLTLEQLLYAATLTNDNATKVALYKQAADQYKDARAYNNLGIALANQGDWAAAEKAFKQAADASSDASINNNIAVAAMAQGKMDEAKQYMAGASDQAKALASVADGNYNAANGQLKGYNAAVNEVLAGDLAAAKSALAGDNSANAEYLRAVIANKEGNAKAAAAYLSSAIAKDASLKAKAATDANLKGVKID